MAANSKIEWTHHTANLWWGRTHVHAGCDNCYAEAFSHRYGHKLWGNDTFRKAIKSVWNDLKKYQDAAAKANEIHRVFVGSMMDIFERSMPVIDSKGNYLETDTKYLRDKYFIEVSKSPNLLHLMLTKRPSNILKYIPHEWKNSPPPNVMYGTSVVDPLTANNLIPQLCMVPGYHFLSIEPMLGIIDLTEHLSSGKIHWVIVGGESGPHRRPFDLYWARIIRDQCKEFNVPFFFKQIDKIRDKIDGIPTDLMIRQLPSCALISKQNINEYLKK